MVKKTRKIVDKNNDRKNKRSSIRKNKRSSTNKRSSIRKNKRSSIRKNKQSSTNKQSSIRKNRQSSTNKRTYKKHLHGGELDLSTIKIPANPVLRISTNTISCFLNTLFESKESGYDSSQISKYGFGSYDAMIEALKTFVAENEEFKDTILDVLLKATDKSQTQTLKKTKRPELPKLPEILNIITNLKIGQSNLAYFFTKNPQDILKTQITELIPDNLKKYIDPRLGRASVSRASVSRASAKSESFKSAKSESLNGSEPVKSLEDVLNDILSKLINDSEILNKIKYLIMKTDYKNESSTEADGWHLSTILLELITNAISNLELHSSVSFKTTLLELNKNSIITCELLNFLLKDESKAINFNLTKLYSALIEPAKESESDYSQNPINEFSIIDFFSKEKNINGELPPFVLLLLSCRINPDVNTDGNPAMNAFKQNIYKMLANNKITCATKTSLLNRLTTKFTTRKPEKSSRSRLTSRNLIEEEEEEERENFLSLERQEGTSDYAPQEVGGAKDKDGNEIITTCSPIEPAKGFVGKATATVTTAAEGFFLNPILKKVCKDLHNNQFSWNTFDELQSIINTIKRASLLGGSKTIQNLICTNLAPYTTFFPLNINSYISTTLIPNNTTFLEQITEYEEQIINAYKSDDTYTDPLCVPMSIINKLGQK